MECEATQVRRLHRRISRLALGLFVLWNYIVYYRVQCATNTSESQLSDVDMNYVFDA